MLFFNEKKDAPQNHDNFHNENMFSQNSFH